MPSQSAVPPIRRDIALADLSSLSDPDAEQAAEEGSLEGNQEYDDLRGLTLADLRSVIAHEDALLDSIATVSDPSDVEDRLVQSRGSSFEPAEELWGLDLGVAGAVVALSTMGACPVASCNGGAFGLSHQSSYAYVAFYISDASLDEVLTTAEQTGCGLIASNGLGHLYGPIDALIAFPRALAHNIAPETVT